MFGRSLSPFLSVLLIGMFSAVNRASAADRMASGTSRMVIQPSSASLAGAKARLSASELQREGAKYVGNYQISVTPYFFKSETGTMSVAVSNASLSKLAAGSPVSFTGSAVTSGTNERRGIMVKATPHGVGSPNGTLTISIATENGELLFASSYALNGN
jgi:hypothetical protein